METPEAADPAATSEPAIESVPPSSAVTGDPQVSTPSAPETMTPETDPLAEPEDDATADPASTSSALPQLGMSEPAVTERVAASRVSAVEIVGATFPSILRAPDETPIAATASPDVILREVERFAVSPGMMKVAEVTEHPEFGTVVRGELEMAAGAPDPATGQNAQETIQFSSFVGSNGEPVILFANLN